MNAYELADKLQREKANTLLYVATIVDSANMLRQQQAEIEVLKMEIHSLTYGKRLAEYLRKAQGK